MRHAAPASDAESPTTAVGSGRVLNGTEFVAYAVEQIQAIDELLTHHVWHGMMCSCGRVSPCPHVTSLMQRRSEFAVRLAEVEATNACAVSTVQLPAMGRARVPVTGTLATPQRVQEPSPTVNIRLGVR
jgi:hypothetical protein